jgi:hypothetical protein
MTDLAIALIGVGCVIALSAYVILCDRVRP